MKLTMKRKEKVVHHCTACGAIKVHWRSRDAHKKQDEDVVLVLWDHIFHYGDVLFWYAAVEVIHMVQVAQRIRKEFI